MAQVVVPTVRDEVEDVADGGMFGDAAKPSAAGGKAGIGFLPGGLVAEVAKAADFGFEVALLKDSTVEFRQVLPGVLNMLF